MKRSKFGLSHSRLFSCDMGELIPMACMEVLPGDTFQHSTSLLLRCSPLLSPVMHPVDVRIHHWYVPLRLIWSDFEDFITGGQDGLNASVFPTRTLGGGASIAVGTLGDYLGLPTGVNALQFSILPMRAYQMIWNEFYRDADLQTEAAVVLTSGNDPTTSITLQNCSWEKDYFTSARPWEQKGPAITIPLGSTAPVEFGGGVSGSSRWRKVSDGSVADTVAGTNWSLDAGQQANSGGADRYDYNPGSTLRANLAGASAITVTALREALALQRFEENKARWGSRYSEVLRSWGVRSSDARLQRPEYLGGGRQTIQFSEVLQTAEGVEPVGEMKGHGIAAMRSNRYRRFFEEHGYVLSLMSVRPKTIYMQGMPRHWNRRFKEDFFQPELQHVGQQEILNKEIYAAHATPNGIFGYQDRYDEYRRQESTVAGEFRSSTLNFWHLAREFSSSPALNSTFVSCVPTERVFAVPSQDVLWCQAKHSIQARRLVSGSARSFIF